MAEKNQGQGAVKDPEHDGRLKENRDEEHGNDNQGRSSNSSEDRRHQDNGQGDVKHPETDGRLKEHGGGTHGQGAVKDPENDGRLKENRD